MKEAKGPTGLKFFRRWLPYLRALAKESGMDSSYPSTTVIGPAEARRILEEIDASYLPRKKRRKVKRA